MCSLEDMDHISPHIDRPLVVALDGALLKTDLLLESINHFVLTRPFQAYRLAFWMAAGKPALKKHLATAFDIAPASLPYNCHLLSWLQEKKKKNSYIVLATASHRLLAEKVAEHLGCFDEVLATEESANLNSRNKRDLLVSRYGMGGFDYIGNDRVDLPVWAAARQAHVISSSPSLIARVKTQGNVTGVFDDGRPPFAFTLFMALRPHQWTKNLLVLVPLLAAHRYTDLASVIQAILAFFIFGLAACSVYLLNDLVDVADDRHHPRKRQRPFAAGHLSLLYGWLLWPILLLLICILASLFMTLPFGSCLAAYIFTTLAYSLWLKQNEVLDVLTLAGLYTLRIIAGAAAISVPVSFWLLSFSMFIFLSLAFMKRFSELKAGGDGDMQEKLRGRGYHRLDLEMVASFGTGSGYVSVLVLALYIQDRHASELYHSPQFIWLACPLLLYWISRAWLIAHRGKMHEDPVVFALKDKMSWVIAACFVGAFTLARVVE